MIVVVPSAYAVTLPSFFDEPCSGSPTSVAICEGVNAVNTELEAKILRINSINATQILQGIDIGILQGNVTSLDTRLTTAEGHIDFHHEGIEIETENNTSMLNEILLNSTSINATSFIAVSAEQSVQDTSIGSLQSTTISLQSEVSTLQSTTTTQQGEIDSIHGHVDVVNLNTAIGPLPSQVETDYTALCNDGSQVKIPGSANATLTNGVNTTSNIPEQIIGTLDVDVEYIETRQTFKMTVTNNNNATGLFGIVTVTCLTFPE